MEKKTMFCFFLNKVDFGVELNDDNDIFEKMRCVKRQLVN